MSDDRPDQGSGNPQVPRGSLAIRVVAMPADANPNGDIFGGWVLGQMDIAGGVIAYDRAQGRVATIAVDAMKFHRPVHIGDILCCYGEVSRVGNTSVAIHVEAWAMRRGGGETQLVTEGTFTFVAIGDDRKPRPIQDL